jgi:hypothetical protein
MKASPGCPPERKAEREQQLEHHQESKNTTGNNGCELMVWHLFDSRIA